jgi:hypothetical protein
VELMNATLPRCQRNDVQGGQRRRRYSVRAPAGGALRRGATLLHLALLGACGGPASKMPVQSTAAVVAAFRDVIAGCSAPLTNAGEIDQRALAASGWSVTSRTSRVNLEDRVYPLDAYPALRATEYEATQWQHTRHVGDMVLIRGDLVSSSRMLDHCTMNGRVSKRQNELDDVVAGLVAHFGRKPDRVGAVPRGGDFLTPRSDPQQTGFYWKLEKHDVYLQTAPGGFASIDVVAMPARDSLDKYSSDRPEHRIVILPGDSAK